MKTLKPILKTLFAIISISLLICFFIAFKEAIENIPTDIAIGFRAECK